MSINRLRQILRYIFYILMALIAIKVVWYAVPKFYDGTIVMEVERLTKSMGALGVLLIVLINILRMLIPILPSEPFELLAGAMYGPVIGMIVCLTGITIGSLLVYLLVKRLEERFVRYVVGEKFSNQYLKLKNSPHIESITCYILLLPGMPKDLFTYVVGLTHIDLKRFIIYVVVLRIPSVIMSTIVGASVLHGKWEQGLTIYIVFGAVALIGIVVHRIILKRSSRKS